MGLVNKHVRNQDNLSELGYGQTHFIIVESCNPLPCIPSIGHSQNENIPKNSYGLGFPLMKKVDLY